MILIRNEFHGVGSDETNRFSWRESQTQTCGSRFGGVVLERFEEGSCRQTRGEAGQAWRESRTGSLQADDFVRVDSIQLLLRPHTFAETGALHDVEQMFGRVESFHEISLSSQFVT